MYLHCLYRVTVGKWASRGPLEGPQPTPEMMHNVKLSYLREEAAHCLLVLLPVLDGPSPRDGKKSVKQKLGPVQKAL